MRHWKIVKHGVLGHIPAPIEPLKCPFCENNLILHDFRASWASQGFYHVDVHMKCHKCDFWACFGVPITPEEHLKLNRSPVHGRVLTHEITSIKDVYKFNEAEIKERLKRFGYW